MSKHIDKVIEEFTRQSKTFNDYQKSFSKAEFTNWAIEKIGFLKSDCVLEVAAGTCGFGRSVAPHVRHVTELDATMAMLEVGKNEAVKQSLANADFVEGMAESLPFGDETFDVVISRLAFHHFKDINKPYEEMARVVKKSGKIAIIDMEARQEELREISDHFEILRDPSHVKNISKVEFCELAEKHGTKVLNNQTIEMPVALKDWMELTSVDSDTQKIITDAMQEDINGGKKTGLEPYLMDNKIYFSHRWMLITFVKEG